MTATPRLALPHILVNQAQKEMTHNAALNRLDILVQSTVLSAEIADPPLAPAEGEAWVVAAPATGAWAGRETMIAQWIGGAWSFLEPRPGMRVRLDDRKMEAHFDHGAWSLGELNGDRLLIHGQQVVGMRGSAIASPTGGTAVDAEARAAIDALIAALVAHGLIAS